MKSYHSQWSSWVRPRRAGLTLTCVSGVASDTRLMSDGSNNSTQARSMSDDTEESKLSYTSRQSVPNP